MEYSSILQEGTPLYARSLLHLGHRAAVDQALSSLARSGRLMRIFQGVNMCPIKLRFGVRGPHLDVHLLGYQLYGMKQLFPAEVLQRTNSI
ncbi:MAG: hypothetical protein OXF08_04850 [Bacteroidetes bacterium]|nr:hypothetical protein [Bacteroidota bacterium]